MADDPTIVMTPQERNLYRHHSLNLRNLGKGGFTQPNGDISTVLQTVVTGPDGRFYSIPSVWGGKQLPPDQSLQQALKLGGGWDYWPGYATPEEADARYAGLHQLMDVDIRDFLRKSKEPR